MKDHIFRVYDIRGKVGPELEIEKVYDLAKSIAAYFKTRDKAAQKVAIAMDGRLHSPTIKENLIKGLLDSGFNVLDLGLVPTPVLYFILHTKNVDAGIMITASHNPKEYNGLKICFGKDVVWGPEIQKIKDIFKTNNFLTSKSKGMYATLSAAQIYTDWLADHFKNLKNLSINAVIDIGNSVNGVIWPLLIQKLNLQNVKLLFAEVDGAYPNHEPDPTIESNMQDIRDQLKTKNYKIGIGFDGDGDRMAVMDEVGYLIPGDKLLAVFAKSVSTIFANAKVILDIKCSQAIINYLNSCKIEPIISPSGHSIIKQNIKKYSATLAGELSCHFFFKDRYFGYDDGTYAALRLFEILSFEEGLFETVLGAIPKLYATKEIRIECIEEQKMHIINDINLFAQNLNDSQIGNVDGVLISNQGGRALVRSSNTQPAISLRFESTTKQGLEDLKNKFIKPLNKYFDSQLLHDKFTEATEL